MGLKKAYEELEITNGPLELNGNDIRDVNSIDASSVSTTDVLADSVSTKQASISLFNVGLRQDKTISSGEVSTSNSWIYVGAESGTSDTLETVSGGEEGDFLLIQAQSGDTITVADGVGNFVLSNNTDETLDAPQDMIYLRYDGASWVEISFSDNA